ncbi:MAG: bifunctional adenosylcobinamide kinase/adenosylcobinamide-phosphate guanylyltransferase [Anaerolineae bacterium]|nr:bifunctional adenosylcobinamide kinase/adenosylcobinamide-phosphate guanylyltransferase [Anaerolineae bacterium]MDW8071166.1 bifunctional adenosylcobinamide kinase/adenosylcobinamide-phosphate guanylyltransferase [Anaerolineae bacterium]
MGKLVFVTGGARSGKSHFAEMLARRHPGRVCYIATAVIVDDEMARRVALHRQRRPADWSTLECHARLADSLLQAAPSHTLLLVDCLTLYLARFLPAALPQDTALPRAVEERLHQQVDEEITAILTATRSIAADVLIVSNEVGNGLVPPYPAGRLFRDLMGYANQILAREAEWAYVVIAGIPLDLKALQAAALPW